MCDESDSTTGVHNKLLDDHNDDNNQSKNMLITITITTSISIPIPIPIPVPTPIPITITTIGIPYVTMILDKCVLDEEHPQFLGLYEGDNNLTAT